MPFRMIPSINSIRGRRFRVGPSGLRKGSTHQFGCSCHLPGPTFVLLLGLTMVGCASQPPPQGTEQKREQPSPPTVLVGKGPDALLLSKDGKKAFVANVEDTTLSVLDLKQARVISTLEVGQSPWGVVHLGSGEDLIVSAWGASRLVIVDGSSLEIKTTIPVAYQPTGIAASSDGSRAYVAGSDHRLHGIDLASQSEFAAIAVGKDPDGVAITPDGASVWVTNTSGSVSVVRLGKTWSETRLETGGKPEQIVAHPQRPLVFISNFTDNRVLIYRTDTLQLIQTLEGDQAQFKGPEEIRFSADGGRFFLAGFDSNNVSCIDVDSLKACGQWTVGSGTIAVEIIPDGRKMVTTNYRDNSVSILALLGAFEEKQ